MHKNHGNRDNKFKNYISMFFFYNPGDRTRHPFMVSSQSILDFRLKHIFCLKKTDCYWSAILTLETIQYIMHIEIASLLTQQLELRHLMFKYIHHIKLLLTLITPYSSQQSFCKGVTFAKGQQRQQNYGMARLLLIVFTILILDIGFLK